MHPKQIDNFYYLKIRHYAIVLYTAVCGQVKGATRNISAIYTGQYPDIPWESGF